MESKLEDLRKWFGKGKKGDWVRVGTDGEIKGQCAREPGEGKPKCMPRDKAHSMSKKDRASSARRKRRQDPMADRPGTGNKPIMVKTDKKESVNEASKVPAGMKFIASYVYKDANGKDHTHTHFRKGKKMTDPVVVHIDGKEWKTFQSFTKSKQAAINHIKGMKESVNESSNINKFKTAAREFDRNKDRNFQSVGDALSTIALRMRMMQSGKSKTGYSDIKGQEIIQKSASRIQGIVNNTFDKEEGKEIRKLLTKHGLYNKGAMGPIMKLTYNTEEKKAVKESINEATVTRSDFDKLKKGDEITITYDSSIRSGTTNTFVVKSKSRSNKYNVDKVTMQLKGKPGGMKFFLYSRGGKDATLALGDMAASMKSYKINESVELEEMNVSKQTNKELMMFYRKYKGKKGEIIRSVTKELIKRGLVKESVEEARQMKDPKKDVMVVKKGKVIVIDKGKEKEYLKKGWELAEESLDEKNVPTNPSLWAKFKAQAKAKFDVYPSAYANGWAAKKYKAAGGSWKKESVDHNAPKSFEELRDIFAGVREDTVNEDFRKLAVKGMGTEKKGEARVGLELDYYDGSGTKRMGKITKVTAQGYIVRDDKDGKNRQFRFHDRAKAKELLGKG